MKARQYINMIGMAAAVLLSSCVKDTLYDTPHPDKGAVAIYCLGMGGADGYAADIDGRVADVTSSPFVYPSLLEPGAYTLVVYNKPDGFTFDGLIASVNALGGAIMPLPGYLRTCTERLNVAADDTLRVSPAPQQRVRDLRLELEVTQGRPELIQSVTATLSGIAGAFDMEAGQTTGDAVSTVFAFTREGSKLTADVRLLGTMGAVQTLVLDIVFVDGGRTQRTEVDLTEAMADFNGDMTTAYRITGTLETPVGMEEGNAEITGWETVEGGDVDAKM